MPRTGSLAEYEETFAALEYLPGWEVKANAIARRAMCHVTAYRAVERETGIPWPVVVAIHSLEASSDWAMGLHCGQRWDRVTTLVPVGKGPFPSWEAAAIDALGDHRQIKAWTIGGIGLYLERFNGGGYLKRGRQSPYLWSGSKAGLNMGLYPLRKFVSDGHYDPAAVSEQVGGMLIIDQLIKLGAWEPIGNSGDKSVEDWSNGGKSVTVYPPDPMDDRRPQQPASEAPGSIPATQTAKDALPLRQGSQGTNVRVLQAALNEILKGMVAPLTIDGRLGPRTAAAVRQAIEVG